MSPLIGLAVNLLPDLAKRVAGDADPARREAIEATMRAVLGTDDPKEAARKLDDTRLAADLRVKLAEIEARAARDERHAEQSRRETELARLRAELASVDQRRQGQLRELESRLSNQADARRTFLGLAQSDNPLAWGPVVVSTIVTAGFFFTLVYLIRGGFAASQTDPVVFQVINIAVGALTAGFATVVSFWLGSSDGSRRKDLATARSLADSAQLQRENAESTRTMVTEQARQAAHVLDRLAPKPGRTPDQADPVERPAPRDTAPKTSPRPAQRPDTKAVQFKTCVETIFAHEGGFVNDPQDPGGATNMGITYRTLANWRGEDVSVDDVRHLARSEAEEIYRANYWNALSCDDLPGGVDLVVFDFGVNAGVSRSAKTLQRVVGTAQDGVIGPITRGAVAEIAPAEIVRAFSDARLAFYRALPHWDRFGRGWSRRTNETLEQALAMTDA